MGTLGYKVNSQSTNTITNNPASLDLILHNTQYENGTLFIDKERKVSIAKNWEHKRKLFVSK